MIEIYLIMIEILFTMIFAPIVFVIILILKILSAIPNSAIKTYKLLKSFNKKHFINIEGYYCTCGAVDEYSCTCRSTTTITYAERKPSIEDYPSAYGWDNNRTTSTEYEYDIPTGDDKQQAMNEYRRKIFIPRLVNIIESIIHLDTDRTPLYVLEVHRYSECTDRILIRENYGRKYTVISIEVIKHNSISTLRFESGGPYIKCPDCTTVYRYDYGHKCGDPDAKPEYVYASLINSDATNKHETIKAITEVYEMLHKIQSQAYTCNTTLGKLESYIKNIK